MSFWQLLKRVLPSHRVPERERRRCRRAQLKLAAEIRTEKASLEGSLTDISVVGARVWTPVRLKARSNVAVGIPISSKRGLIRCRVLWSTKQDQAYCAGLMFDDTEQAKTSSWLQDTLVSAGFSQDNVKERRGYVRLSTQIKAFLTDSSDITVAEGSMTNFGVAGAMLLSNMEVPVGTACMFCISHLGALARLSVPATVLTVRRMPQNRNFYLGLRFDENDDPSVKSAFSLLSL